jgi:hypothetical protein
VTRESLLGAGEALGLTRRIGERELDRMTESLPPVLADLVQDIENQNAGYPKLVRVFLGGELRAVRAIQHVVVPDMLQRVARPKSQNAS